LRFRRQIRNCSARRSSGARWTARSGHIPVCQAAAASQATRRLAAGVAGCVRRQIPELLGAPQPRCAVDGEERTHPGLPTCCGVSSYEDVGCRCGKLRALPDPGTVGRAAAPVRGGRRGATAAQSAKPLRRAAKTPAAAVAHCVRVKHTSCCKPHSICYVLFKMSE